MAQNNQERPTTLAGVTRTTTDHQEIRTWVESRGGRPVRIVTPDTEKLGSTLRIDFSGNPSEAFQVIGWDDFFRQFNAQQLAFVHQIEDRQGDEGGVFHTFVDRGKLKQGSAQRPRPRNNWPSWGGPGTGRTPASKH